MSGNPEISTFTPGGPEETPPGAEPERAAVEARTHLRLDRERDLTSRAVARALNYPADLRLPSIESTYVRPQTTAEEMRKVAQSRNPFDDLRMYSRVFFGSDSNNNMEGLGRVVRGIEKLDATQLAAVIREVSAGQNRGLAIPDKVNMSLMRATAEFAMENRGYVYDSASARGPGQAPAAAPGAPSAGPAPHRILNGETIERIMKQLGPEAEGLWKEVVAGIRVGPLAHGGVLPGGMVLRFDDRGRPIFIAPDERTPTPEVPQFQRTAAAATPAPTPGRAAETPGKPERERAIDFLLSRLKPGDILVAGARRRAHSRIRRGFGMLGRIGMDGENSDGTPLHSVHAMVYLGDGRAVDIRKGGGTVFDLRQNMRTEYNAFTVARIGDDAKAAVFAREAERIAGTITKYSLAESYHRGREYVGASRGDRRADSTPNAAICVDLVSRAGQAAGIAELANIRSTVDIVRALDVPYSIDVELPMGFRG